MKPLSVMILFSLIALAAVTGCRPEVASFEIKPGKVQILSSQQKPSLTILAYDQQGTQIQDIRPVWKSLDPDIVTVDEAGTLLPKGTGQATVIATVGDIKQEVPVEVILCSSLKTEKNEVTLNTGESTGLDIQALDEKDDPIVCPLQWAAADNSIARVDENGMVYGVSPGETEISATTGDLKAKIKIVVKKPEPPVAVVADVKPPITNAETAIGKNLPGEQTKK